MSLELCPPIPPICYSSTADLLCHSRNLAHVALPPCADNAPVPVLETLPTPASATQQHILFHSPENVQSKVPSLIRHNPNDALRRSSVSGSGLSRLQGSLVRQEDRNREFVKNLVATSVQIVQAIWPRASTDRGAGMSLKQFIEETLRRSHCTNSTLQISLYYLLLIKWNVPRSKLNRSYARSSTQDQDSAIACGRRMFLTALVLGSKYLQDRNFSTRAWSKISGLSAQEIHNNELIVLKTLGWNLHTSQVTYRRWSRLVLAMTPPPQGPAVATTLGASPKSFVLDWANVLDMLTVSLDNVVEIITSNVLHVDVQWPAPQPSVPRLTASWTFPASADAPLPPSLAEEKELVSKTAPLTESLSWTL